MKNILIICTAIALLFSGSALADRRHGEHHRRDNHHERDNRSHRGAWIAGAAVVGGLIGYAIADSKSPQERRSNIKAYCENRVPERYAHSKRLTTQWVKGCMLRVEEELDAKAEEAYNEGYSSGHP
jgi:hypothetical protein